MGKSPDNVRRWCSPLDEALLHLDPIYGGYRAIEPGEKVLVLELFAHLDLMSSSKRNIKRPLLILSVSHRTVCLFTLIPKSSSQRRRPLCLYTEWKVESDLWWCANKIHTRLSSCITEYTVVRFVYIRSMCVNVLVFFTTKKPSNKQKKNHQLSVLKTDLYITTTWGHWQCWQTAALECKQRRWEVSVRVEKECKTEKGQRERRAREREWEGERQRETEKERQRERRADWKNPLFCTTLREVFFSVVREMCDGVVNVYLLSPHYVLTPENTVFPLKTFRWMQFVWLLALRKSCSCSALCDWHSLFCLAVGWL